MKMKIFSSYYLYGTERKLWTLKQALHNLTKKIKN